MGVYKYNADSMEGLISNLADCKNQIDSIGQRLDSNHKKLANESGYGINNYKALMVQEKNKLNVQNLHLQTVIDYLKLVQTETVEADRRACNYFDMGSFEKQSIVDKTRHAVENGEFAVEQVHDIIDVFKKTYNLCSEVVDYKSESIKKLLDSKAVKGLDKVMDLNKICGYIKEGDMKGLLKFVGKEGMKKIADYYGYTGFAKTGYVKLAENMFENYFSSFETIDMNDGVLESLLKFTWHNTGWTLLETGTEIAYDIYDGVNGTAKEIAKFWGVDLNYPYEAGIDEFYKDFEELTGYVVNNFSIDNWINGSKLAIEGIGAWWAKTF